MIVSKAQVDQASELRKGQAMLQEKLAASEAGLRQSELNDINLKNRELEHLKTITNLEADISQARVQSSKFTDTLICLRSTELQKKELEDDAAKLRKQIAALSEEEVRRQQEIESTKTALRHAEVRCEQAKAGLLIVQNERTSHCTDETSRCGSLRSQMTLEAHAAISRQQDEYKEAINQLTQKQANEIEKSSRLVEEVHILRSANERLELINTQRGLDVQKQLNNRQREVCSHVQCLIPY